MELRPGGAVDRFTVIRRLGSGGMGVVWLVRDQDGARYAVKVLSERSPSLAARLRTEGRLQAALAHPNVVRVIGTLDLGGQPGLLLEYVAGPTLAELLSSGGPRSTDQIDALARGILAGAAAAHARGWVHRDLKPQNVLLAADGGSVVPKVADFGIAKIVDPESEPGTTTRHGIGTRRYMSFEQVAGARADPTMDVFSLGVLLFELIEGRPAFPTVASWQDAIRRGPHPVPSRPDLPERMRKAIEASLTDIGARARDASELLRIWEADAPAPDAPFGPDARLALRGATHVRQDGRRPWTDLDPEELEHVALCPRCRDAATRAAGPATADQPPLSGTMDRGVVLVGISWNRATAIDLGRRWDETASRFGGRRFEDGVALFDAPGSAVEAALAFLDGADGRDPELKVGLHAPGSDGMGRGLAALRRLVSLARPGQVLATSPALVGVPGVSAAGLGSWRIAELHEPIALYALRGGSEPPETDVAVGVFREDDTWVPRQADPTLPAERDRFVGRTVELADLAARLQGGDRLITVHGPGGVGKTRLVLHHLRRNVGAWPGGVRFCDLSEARTREGIVSAVARALGVPLDPGDAAAQLGYAIAARGSCLIVLDNVEQVAAIAGEVLGPWLDRAGAAVFVATSRVVLGVPGERVLRVDPLETGPASVLFTVRATAARAGFDAAAHEDRIRTLVGLLDGIPLAIELCAARVRTLDLDGIVERLGDRFRLLAGGAGRPARQATLRATLDWSWALLAAWEQDALAQCSVFSGGFTLDALEAVLDLGAHPDAPWTVDVLQALVEKSLVQHAADGRFDLLATVREYAAEHLVGAAREAAERRHGSWFADRFEDREPRLEEHDNLLAATESALSRREMALAGRAALALVRVMELGAPSDDIVGPLVRVLEGGGLPAVVEIRVLRALADTRVHAGRGTEARAGLRQALALSREISDARSEARVLLSLAELDVREGATSEVPLEALLGLVRALGLQREESEVLAALGRREGSAGRQREGIVWLEEALAVAHRLEDSALEARVLTLLGMLERPSDPAKALRRFEEALRPLRAQGDRRGEARVLLGLAAHAGVHGPLEEAHRRYSAALRIYRELGERVRETWLMGCLGLILSHLGRFSEARAQLDEAVAAAVDLGNSEHLLCALQYRADLAMTEGRLEATRSDLDRALALAPTAADRRHQGTLHRQLALLEELDGRAGDGRPHVAAALEIYGQTSDPTGEALAWSWLGRLALAEGDTVGARTALDTASARADATPPVVRGHVLLAWAELHGATGDVDAVRRTLDEAEVLLRGQRLELARYHCIRATLLRDTAALSEAERQCAEIGVGARSDIGRRLECARRSLGD